MKITTDRLVGQKMSPTLYHLPHDVKPDCVLRRENRQVSASLIQPANTQIKC